MPDFESFIVSAKNQEPVKSGIKRRKKPAGQSDEEEEEVSYPSGGTRTRPGPG